MRYILLFLYITRNDLFRNLSDPKIVESHERVIFARVALEVVLVIFRIADNVSILARKESVDLISEESEDLEK